MNSPDSERRFLQAGEYVLGTLDSEEIAEFNRQLEYDDELAQYVVEWQEKLQPVAEAVTPVRPPAIVWRRLTGQLGMLPVQTTDLRPGPDSHRRRQQRKRSKLVAWQWIGPVAMAAATILGIALWQIQRTPATSPFDVISVVSSTEDNAPLWVINASLDTQTMRVTAISPPPINADQDHQLWLVKPGDAGVTSLGILPRTANITQITTVPQLRDDAVAFAVSLEPLGGSPASVPTGPVLYQAPLNIVTEITQ